MPTNIELLCIFVLIRNSPKFPADNSCNPISCRRFGIPVDADFLQPPRFPATKSVVSYVPLISKSNENMGFVGNLTYMDYVLLVVSNPPTKPLIFADLLSLVI